MDHPTVTVAIAAYNAAPYLRDALESVRRQTFQDLEVVIVDDGSTDETWAVMQELADEWDKVRIFRAEHGGTPVNKNRAIERARGEWIAILDADDLWAPDKLERCLDFLREHPDLSIVYTPMDTIAMDGTPMKGHSKTCHSGRITEQLFQSIFVHDPAVVFHRRVVDECGGFDESIPVGSGHEFWLRVSTKFDFGLIDEPLATRRWHETSLTRSNRAAGRLSRAEMLDRFYHEEGGEELIPCRKAMRRLSKVWYGVGKLQFRAGCPVAARDALRKALGYRWWNVKALGLYLLTWPARLFRRG